MGNKYGKLSARPPQTGKVTFAALILFEGDAGRAVYGIYRGLKRGQSIGMNAASTQQIAREEVRGRHEGFTLKLAEKYQTAEYPAVRWA